MNETNNRLYERYDADTLKKYLVSKDKINNRPCLNKYCLQAMFHKLKWKNADNEYHYSSENPEYHWYSDQAVEEVIKKILSNPGYLIKARKDYSQWRKKGSR